MAAYPFFRVVALLLTVKSICVGKNDVTPTAPLQLVPECLLTEGSSVTREWGSVCAAHENFTEADSEVACFQLGFAGARKTGSNWQFCKETNNCAPDTSHPWICGVTCKGTERYLGKCYIDPETTEDCPNSYGVVIFCTGELK